jgi:hypothetical protein
MPLLFLIFQDSSVIRGGIAAWNLDADKIPFEHQVFGLGAWDNLITWN